MEMSLSLTEEPKELRKKFFDLKTTKDIANLLDVKDNDFIYFIYRTNQKRRYSNFKIKKKNGKTRNISAPSPNIKILQQKLNQVLQAVYYPKPSVHGFVRERSIVTNATKHIGKKYVFNIDLKDFFPSINFGRVRGMFMGKPYNLPRKVSTVLAHLCCFNQELPQGAPTSPIISNMICGKLDSQLQRLAYKYRCTYSRYADDITFSTTLKKFPTGISTINEFGQIETGDELVKAIEDNGFEINPKKIWFRGQDRRQEVTGIIVNQFPNLRRKFLNQIRAMLHAWQKYDIEKANAMFVTRYDNKHRSSFKGTPHFKYVLRGKIEYVGMVRGKQSAIYLRLIDELRKLDPDLVPKSENPIDHFLERFDELYNSADPQKRGFMLQILLKDAFDYFGIPLIKSFTRNEGAEQIDGAFDLDGLHYIVECRWRAKLADGRETDGLLGPTGRSGSMGLFLSINGWSDNVIPLLKQNPNKCIILMDGTDFRKILSGDVELASLLRAKVRKLKFDAEPFYGADDFLKDQ
jgi:RNA-directed DNA polymerase